MDGAAIDVEFEEIGDDLPAAVGRATADASTHDEAAVRAAAARGGANGTLLDAIATTSRVPYLPPELVHAAGADADLPVGHGGSLLAPSSAAAVLAAADLRDGDRVLEIGCSTGWTTRILLAVGCDVVACERVAPLARRAAAVLGREAPGSALEVRTRDVLRAGPPAGPFDRVVLWTPVERLPRLAGALVEGGLLVARVADHRGRIVVATARRRGGALDTGPGLPARLG